MVTRQRKTTALLISAALLATACGIDSEDTATPLTSIPPGLSDGATSGITATTATQGSKFKLVPAWAVPQREDGIVRVEVPWDEAPSLQDAYDLLVQGPSPDDFPNYTTYIFESFGGILPESPTDDKVLWIEFPNEEIDIQNLTNAALIEAQLVCTFIAFSSVDTVGLRYSSGEVISMTDFSQQPIEGPASAADYRDCENPEGLTEDTTATADESGVEAETSVSTALSG